MRGRREECRRSWRVRIAPPPSSFRGARQRETGNHRPDVASAHSPDTNPRSRGTVISAQTRRVCREGKPLRAFPDYALANRLQAAGYSAAQDVASLPREVAQAAGERSTTAQAARCENVTDLL